MAFDIELFIDRVKAPCYVFSQELLEKRVEKVKKAFGEKVDICYSIKANPFLLTMLPETFAKVEVCSPGELSICKSLGIPGEKVLFSGVNKSEAEIREAMEYGAGIITAESIMHYDAICKVAKEIGTNPKVLLRLTSDSQFGIDKEDLKNIIKERDKHPEISIVGLHYFSGTQKKGSKKSLKEIDALIDFMEEVKEETGLLIERLEYGAGFSSEYFSSPEEAEEKEMAQLMEVAPYIKALGERVNLTVEMGRFFAADSGFYLSSVVDTKTNDGVNYAIMDGGAHQLKYDGQLGGMLVPYITTSYGAREESDQEWTLAGSLCTTQDIIARNVNLGSLKPGDILAFHRAGAYSVTEGIALFLSRDLPRVYSVLKDGELICLRDRIETFRFNIPEREDWIKER